jgi:hypothetical protein
MPLSDSAYSRKFKDIIFSVEDFSFLFHRVQSGDAIVPNIKGDEPIQLKYPLVFASLLFGEFGGLPVEGHEQEFIKAVATADDIAWDLTLIYNILTLHRNKPEINSCLPEELAQILKWCEDILNSEYAPFAQSEIPIIKQAIANYQTFTEPPLSESANYGFVYLACSSTGHYKIGRSKSPHERVKHFDVQMPVEVKMLHFIETDDAPYLEEKLHTHYEHLNFKGEWFNLTDEDVEKLKTLSQWRCHVTHHRFDGAHILKQSVPEFVTSRHPTPRKRSRIKYNQPFKPSSIQRDQ